MTHSKYIYNHNISMAIVTDKQNKQVKKVVKLYKNLCTKIAHEMPAPAIASVFHTECKQIVKLNV